MVIFMMVSTSLYAQELIEFESEGKYGLKNSVGEVVVPPIYTSLNDFSEGLLAVYVGGRWDEWAGMLLGGQWGFVDSTGKVVIKPQFSDAHSFSEGLCSVAVIDNPNQGVGYWGFIDKTGRMVIPAQFSSAGWFNDERAEVQLAGRTYFIDKTGTELIIPQDTTLTMVDDVDPKYINGGVLELMKFINDNLNPKHKSYLIDSRSRSYVEIIIGTDGKVKEATLLRGVNQEADNDLLRVVKMLEFVPEVRWGRTLEVKHTLIHNW